MALKNGFGERADRHRVAKFPPNCLRLQDVHCRIPNHQCGNGREDSKVSHRADDTISKQMVEERV
jgi:hypothetical protein